MIDAPMNVLEICLDDAGYTDIASVPTPNLDLIIKVSHNFPRSYSASPMCSPSRVAQMTGQYSSRFDIGKIIKKLDTVDLPDGTITKGSLFDDAGYATAHFGKWHLHAGEADGPQKAEFDISGATLLHNPAIQLVDGSGELGSYFKWNRVENGVEAVSEEYMTAAQVRSAASYWQTTPGPKFVQLWLTAPHAPFHDPPAEFLPVGWPTLTDEREQFEAMLIAADTLLGELLAVVDLETTMVVLWSDNGTPWQVPGPGQDPDKIKRTMYEGGVNIPFYVHMPGQTEAKTERRLISTVDLFNTYSELIGSQLCTLDGISFARQLGMQSAPQLTRDWVYAVRFSDNGPPPYKSREQMVRTNDGWKLIRFQTESGPDLYEMYYLPDDPNEETQVFDVNKRAELLAIMHGLP